MNRTKSYAAALLTASLLAGCSVGAADVGKNTSIQMQAGVKEIAVSAASADYPAAVVKLDALQSQLDQALAARQVGGARGAQIQAAIDQVRADLGALVLARAQALATPPPITPGPSPDTAKATSGSDSPKEKRKAPGADNHD